MKTNVSSFSIDALLNGVHSASSTPTTSKDFSTELPSFKKGCASVSLNHLDGVGCRLESPELWNKFHQVGMEMIITKVGRRMFPVLTVTLTGLAPDHSYDILLDMAPIDGLRYRYSFHRSSWLPTGRIDGGSGAEITAVGCIDIGTHCSGLTSVTYRHPSGVPPSRTAAASNPASDDVQNPSRVTLAFDKLKLTNCPETSNQHTLFLHSMTKYQPRIHVRLSGDQGVTSVGLSKTFVFGETSFMAVTAYQNQLVTKMKIQFNPFAKGFRRMQFDRLGNRLQSTCSPSIESALPNNLSNESITSGKVCEGTGRGISLFTEPLQ